MKKVLLSAVTLFAAICVNAQEVGQISSDDLGITSDATSVAAGTEFAKTTNVTMSAGADDTYKNPSCSGGGVSYIKFDGNQVDGTVGIQGQTNPKDVDGGTSSTTLVKPATGAFYTFDVAADGYLYVVGKISTNKAYSVFEESTAIGYTLAAADQEEKSVTDDAFYTITIENDTEDADGIGSVTTANKYYNAGILWPEKILAGWDYTSDTSVTWTAIGGSGMGYITFPVFADCQYIVNANGSKFTACGFYYSPTEATEIIGYDSEGNAYCTYVGSAADGIQSVAVEAAAENAPAYNLAGQQVTSAYKGVVLKGGKKYINK